MKGIKDLTQGPILRQLFTLAAPIMATSLMQMAYSLTDIAWVGRWSTEAVAATSAVGILTWLGSSISLLPKVGAEVTVAQQIGQKNSDAAQRYATQNVMIAALLALLTSALLLLGATPIMQLFGMEAPITAMGVSYLRIVATAMPFSFLGMTFIGIFNAAGRSGKPFVICSIGLAVNMLLDPLFIFGLKWGVEGAAWATWLSQCTVFLLFLYQLKIKRSLFPTFRFYTTPVKREISKIFHIGTPVASLNALFGLFSFMISQITVGIEGHIGLLVFNAVGQIEAICWNSSQGLSTALSAFVAQNFGAKKISRVVRAYKSANLISILFGALCTLLFIGFGPQLFALFIPDPATHETGSSFMFIDGFSMIFMMLEITRQGLFYGYGHTMPPAIVSVGGNAMRFPLIWLFLSLGWGIHGVWWAISISSILKGIASTVWFEWYRRKQMLTTR